MLSAWPKASVGSSPEKFARHLQDAAVRCSAVLLEVSLSWGHQNTQVCRNHPERANDAEKVPLLPLPRFPLSEPHRGSERGRLLSA